MGSSKNYKTHLCGGSYGYILPITFSTSKREIDCGFYGAAVEVSGLWEGTEVGAIEV
jgi:hypothetical protein